MSTECTSLFRVINEVNRRRILAALYTRELSVQELQTVLSLGQSTISAHLAQLKLSNLVDSRRQGRYVLYRFAKGINEAIDTFVDSLVTLAHEEPWYERDQRKLSDLLKRKEEASLSFYEGVDTQNKRHPGQTDFSVAIGLLRSIRDKRIIDIGCGSGHLAKEFSTCNKSVLGIDIEEKQIEIAKEICKGECDNLTFLVASGEDTGQKDKSTDLVLFSQSLHHIAEPHKAIAEAYRILDTQGILILLDLHQHTQTWVKDIYGDVYMGFEKKEIKTWLETAGFSDVIIDIDARDEEFPQFETMIVTAQKR